MADPAPDVSPFKAGLGCKCPRCGAGALFKPGLSLDVAEACDRCGQSYAFADAGDGPAVFAIILLGFLMLGAALIVEFRFSPPLWLHVVMWTPVTLLLAFGMLRPMKATLIALQFKNKASLGQLSKD